MPGVVDNVSNFFFNVYIFSWDFLITILNLVLPKKREGHVVPEGHIGYEGKWGEYIPPKEGDSRSACPGLNAMANHGACPTL